MAQELSQSGNRLNRILGTWRDWQGTRLDEAPRLVRQLQGKSNETFLVESSSERFVVRINSENRKLGVDRDIERQVLSDIADARYSPDVVYIDESALVTRFIAGKHPAPESFDRWVADAGALLAEIHSTKTSINTRLEPVKHAMDYWEQQDSAQPLLARCVDTLCAAPELALADICLCHVDPIPTNLISTTSGWYAIDWEYSRLCDPAFDLAVLLETVGAEDSHERLLIDAYGNPQITERITPFRRLYHLIEILWWELQPVQPDNHPERVHSLAAEIGV